MKYIKTPVLVKATGSVLVDSSGRVMMTVVARDFDYQSARLQAIEVKDALNAHDELVAERDELKAKLAELTEALSLRWQWGKKED